MRKKKTIKIDDLEITINELTIEDILSISDILQEKNPDLKSFLPRLIQDCEPEKIMKQAPSELRRLWEGIREVNADFFEICNFLGVDVLLKNILEKIKTDLFRDYVSRFKSG